MHERIKSPPTHPPPPTHQNSILKEAKAAGHAVCGGHISGMFGFFFTEGPVRCFADAAKSDTVRLVPSTHPPIHASIPQHHMHAAAAAPNHPSIHVQNTSCLLHPPTHPPTPKQAKFAKWHRGMLERGFYLAPSQYEAGFMSLAHTEADIDATIAAAREVFKTL